MKTAQAAHRIVIVKQITFVIVQQKCAKKSHNTAEMANVNPIKMKTVQTVLVIAVVQLVNTVIKPKRNVNKNKLFVVTTSAKKVKTA